MELIKECGTNKGFFRKEGEQRRGEERMRSGGEERTRGGREERRLVFITDSSHFRDFLHLRKTDASQEVTPSLLNAAHQRISTPESFFLFFSFLPFSSFFLSLAVFIYFFILEGIFFFLYSRSFAVFVAFVPLVFNSC